MQLEATQLNILIVEDNPADIYLIEDMLESFGKRIGAIYKATRMSEAKEMLRTNEVHLALLDLSLPDSFGLDSLLEITDADCRIPIIVLTGYADTEMALKALNQNAQDYLVKGQFDAGLLLKSIEYSIERKKAEERILMSEEKYRQMFYRNPFPMWIYEPETFRFLEVNNAALQKYGFSRDVFLSLSINDILVSKSPMVHDGNEVLWLHRTKNGSHIIVEFTSHVIPFNGGTAMQAQVNDVSEKIRLQNELVGKKQELVEAVLEAQENERKNIGRELHDNINQILTAVKLNLGLAMDHPDLQEKLLAKSIQNVAQVMDEIRKLAKELILPGNLKELGLVYSVEDLAKEMLEPQGIQRHCHIATIPRVEQSEDLKLNIFRMVQEQLCNIVKYAAASSVTIQLFEKNGQVHLHITDDGRGFDPLVKHKGVGLTNIISRAQLFSGQVTINSYPGGGCNLQVVLSLNQPNISTPNAATNLVLF
ncbi:response regulator [Pseudocnuella soli]|uniref:response regulator n=1 Tax=Pseudocnuella soli TaxID=2502779 RepID=UPI00104500B3|nr:response regulator [Pseudocnuella soli]